MEPGHPLQQDEEEASFHSALIKEATSLDRTVGLFAQFGGQGTGYFQELHELYHGQATLVQNLIERASIVLGDAVETPEARGKGLHREGLDLLQWLRFPESQPPKDYLSSAPISYPLILLTQLSHYLATAVRLFRHDPIQNLKKLWKGATGHSQGIIAAVVVSASSDEDSFVFHSVAMIKYMFWHGFRSQECFFKKQGQHLSLDLVRASEEEGFGKPAPLLAVLGLPIDILRKHVNVINEDLQPDVHIEVSLHNGSRAFVCSGSPQSLRKLTISLRRIQAKFNEEQSRIPYSKRKVKFTTQFLGVSAPFHSSCFMKEAADWILEDVKRLKLEYSARSLTIPVYSTYDGSDLRQSRNLMEDLIKMQCMQPVIWKDALKEATNPSITHIIDFGPGGLSGSAGLTARIKEGTGVGVVLACSDRGDVRCQPRQDLFSADPQSVKFAQNWERDFAPQLLRLQSGNLVINTKFSRILGKPPIMVAGMTPCTVSTGIVAAFTNAGYHGELAGGGLSQPAMFTSTIDSLCKELNPGEGIHINILYLNPKLWGFQFGLSMKLRQEGAPIDSITVAAGVPTIEKAEEILGTLKENGMTLVGFKPGSMDAIKQVVNIAANHPDMNILLQWTGGRAGGHHSFEDAHHPILEVYPMIRRYSNIILVMGSGLGGVDDSLEYLKGTWSLPYGFPRMPFDAVLMGSRIMVAKEALTSDAAKELIVNTPGVDHEQSWEESYTSEAGGVLTVISELGEPIHCIATRGMKLWREFDNKFFSLPKAQQEKEILAHKDYIIDRVNADYQRLYFGKKGNGTIVDIDEMTYAEVAHRMVELMVVDGHWIHRTYALRFHTFLQRIEERFHAPDPSESFVGPNALPLVLSNPQNVLTQLLGKYPLALVQLISVEDLDFFLMICKERGKPVNFIPMVDGQFQFWFKKDSLWFSENLEFVPDGDVDRTCILQGPVAVKHSKIANEPVGELLGGIEKGIIQALKIEYDAENRFIPMEDYLGGPPLHYVSERELPEGVKIIRKAAQSDSSSEIHIHLPAKESQLPEEKLWLGFLASVIGGIREKAKRKTWWTALLTSSELVHGKQKVSNYIPSIVKPRVAQTYVFEFKEDKDGDISRVRIFDNSSEYPSIEFSRNQKDPSRIVFSIMHQLWSPQERVPLTLTFTYEPQRGTAPLSLSMDNRLIKEFYSALWFGGALRDFSKWSHLDTFESECTMTRSKIERFAKATGISLHLMSAANKLQTPLDFAIVAAWESLMRALFTKEVDVNLLKLLHLSYSYRMLSNMPVYEGDTIKSSVEVVEHTNSKNPNGKRIGVKGSLFKGGVAFMEITSYFFIPGVYMDYHNTFQKVALSRQVVIHDKKAKAILESKPWFCIDSDKQLKVGDTLVFKAHSTFFPRDDKVYSAVETKGTISRKMPGTLLEPTASIDFRGSNLFQDPVQSYLQRHGTPVDKVQIFEDGGYPVLKVPDERSSPEENHSYAIASGDFNPIHTNVYIVDFVGLPAPITHGMWTACYARNVLDKYVSKHDNPFKVRNFTVQFVDKVKPKEYLSSKISHVGMKNGLKMVEVEVQNEDNVLILKGSAEVEQPLTAFVFTGQGSAEVGMGMDLYKSSPHAKEVWDRAEGALMEQFGFSILEIVNKNPKELTVHFGGPRGSQIREKYMSLRHQITSVDKGGNQSIRSVPLFPDITNSMESYTFHHPEGLLFATQFTQPALTLMEKAAFTDMDRRGLVSDTAMFAGHSLGEYAALSSVGNLFPEEVLVELVFLRGITMQNAVERDEKGRSSFGMIAVNPARIGVAFTAADLRELVDQITTQTGKLIQVVNYNVENWQYIITGYNSSLESLRVASDILKAFPARKKDMDQLVKHVLKTSPFSDEVALQRGYSTIPLPGIDVPFHSRLLLNEVPNFREYLLHSLNPQLIDVDLLQSRYIPNLTAKPFECSFEYAELVIQATEGASALKDILKSKEFDLTKQKDKQELAFHICVELLAYQFASPVRWIETQDVFFQNDVDRLVEIGPGSTLQGMAKRTLAGEKYLILPSKEILSFKQDKDQIYYENESAAPVGDSLVPAPAPNMVKRPANQTESAAKKNQEDTLARTGSVTDLKHTVAPPAAPAPAASAAPIADQPVTPFESLQVLLSLKLKKNLNEIRPEHTIKDLVGGKSAVQNEILGDLQKEFQNDPEGAAEMPLDQLAQVIGVNYSKLGAQSNKQIARLASTKMPGGYGMAEIKEHLSKERMLGEGHTEGAMVHALSMEPDARLETVSNANQWWDSVVNAYAAKKGIVIGSRSQAGSSGAVMHAIDSEELYAYQRKHTKLFKAHMQNYASFLEEDLRAGGKKAETETVLRRSLEAELQLLEKELGKHFTDGIRPTFDPLKIRRYNSFWNWARQEAVQLLQESLSLNQTLDSRHQQKLMNLMNRGTPELVGLVNYLAQSAQKGGNALVAEHGEKLAAAIANNLEKEPVLQILDSDHRGPKVQILREGRVVYKETARSNVNTFQEFVKEMRQGFTVEQASKNCNRWRVSRGRAMPSRKKVPHLFLHANKPTDPTAYHPMLTRQFYKAMNQLTTEGITYQGKTALLTGCGKGSIGLEVVKGLLAGGARVIVTTSRFSKETADMYRRIYKENGGRDSELIVLPFNQASASDVSALVSYIYGVDGLNLDLDYILPFAAIPEGGRDITNIDSTSELAHRIMLTNLLRLIGHVKSKKEELGKDTNPSYVVLPLSPNHGLFGHDGLYAESKIGLETLFNKWESEGWHNYMSIAGAVIGWTRGTGLMEGNNLVAAGIEQLGCRTFNQSEIAYSILALLAPEIMSASQNTPIWADFTGGMGFVQNLKATVDVIRSQIMEKADLTKAVHVDTLFDRSLSEENHKQNEHKPEIVVPRANFTFSFPSLPSQKHLDSLSYLRNMVDLDKTVVVVGMGEVGPWGNTRTRWEIEKRGEFSVEGCIELAWIMGLVRYHNGSSKDGQRYIGWVDAKSGAPVKDFDIKKLYEDQILLHCGIREVEPELFDGYDPKRKQFITEVAINEDLSLIEVMSREEADMFKLEHGEKCDTFEIQGRWFIQMKKGATMFIPRALKFDRFVAGQIPTGWNPALYGIPQDIITQVDQVTLFNLVSTAEALISAGITDPYELYEYVHVSEVGNTTGSGIGGMKSIQRTYKGRFMEKPTQADILQELFINVMPAWVNMLLLSSSGPIKTPVGACATAAESIEMGMETILSGKAQVVIVGGFDDYHEESAYEFAQMKATSDSELETKMGRTPREMSRPASSSRGGFMESQGSGNQILMTAHLAVTMGLPIYAIVALANTASDKEGRSVPAPGRGILTTAREIRTTSSPLLDINYRRHQLEQERIRIAQWREQELLATDGYADFIEKESIRKEKGALALYGQNFFWGDPSISPIRGALAVWGLTVDDIAVASFHGTGTKANDLNESEVTQLQMDHLGRTKGNAMPVITQKYLTGHPKGAAAAWMANGLIQCMVSGSIPGNANADNIDPKLRQFDCLLYNDSTIHMASQLSAGLMKSFGFGQAGGEILFVHPNYVLAVLAADDYGRYIHRRNIRERKAYKYGHSVLTGKQTMIQVKSSPPYAEQDEAEVYLDPTARAQYDPKEGTWRFPSRGAARPDGVHEKKETEKKEKVMKKGIAHAKSISAATSVEVTMRKAAEGLRQPMEQGIGIDVQVISSIPTDDEDFLRRNFTELEIAHCRTDNPEQTKSRFAGRWAAKEAVIKAISSSIKDSDGPMWKGSGAPVKGIEILPTTLGPPKVVLHDHAANVATVLGIREIKVTISHSGEYAVAQAVAI